MGIARGRIGRGAYPHRPQELTEERLAHAISQAVADEAMRSRAAALGALIRAEDGVTAAAMHFGKLALKMGLA